MRNHPSFLLIRWSNKLCPVQNRWSSRRLPRVYDILSRYSTPLGSHIPEIKGLAYADDGNIIAKLSTALKLISMLAPVFKKDANLVFDIRKTKVLAKGPSQTICLNAQNISSTPTLTLQILLTTSHGTCSRQRV